jgi:hypothetical protein
VVILIVFNALIDVSDPIVWVQNVQLIGEIDIHKVGEGCVHPHDWY